MKIKNTLVVLFTLLMVGVMPALAGNKDRVGQAGATELLINPWARSSGWLGANTASVTGVEAMRFNPGGLALVNKTEFSLARTQWLSGSDIDINAIGIALKIGDSGALGLSLVSLSMGEIPITTENQPDFGSGGTYEPQFLHIGIGYSKSFSESIHGGIVFRIISESIADVSANGFAFDAGIQYVTGPKDNARFGIALRNVGAPLQFTGDGLDVAFETIGGQTITGQQRTEPFEIPSLLNIGGAYDFYLSEQNRLTLAANFTSNSFRNDFYGIGVEYAFKELFMLRGGFRYEEGLFDDINTSSALTGFSAGFTFDVPLKAGGPNLGFDYSYRTTENFSGTHSFGLRINL